MILFISSWLRNFKGFGVVITSHSRKLVDKHIFKYFSFSLGFSVSITGHKKLCQILFTPRSINKLINYPKRYARNTLIKYLALAGTPVYDVKPNDVRAPRAQAASFFISKKTLAYIAKSSQKYVSYILKSRYVIVLWD